MKKTIDWLQTPALVTWVEKECPMLGAAVSTHIEALTDLDSEASDGLWRCIMHSVRQRFDNPHETEPK